MTQDSLIGTTECDLKSLFKRIQFEKNDEEAGKSDTDASSKHATQIATLTHNHIVLLYCQSGMRFGFSF
jgi:hypothetical protein